MSFGMVINHNLGSMNALSALSQNQNSLQTALQQLSTGKKINSAADNAAGLAISQQMQSQINGLGQAQQNAQDGVSLIQTADGALNETQSILQRMNQLAVQASNDSSTNSDRAQIQKEVGQLKSEINNIASTTQFNGKNLLDGSLSAAQSAQGTIENSNNVQAAATAATSGTAAGGAAAAMQTAVSAVNGSGNSITGGNTLASSINVVSGVNDQFKFTVNGTTATATIASSQSGGYTQSQFVQAVQSAVNSALSAATKNGPGAQVNVALTSDGRLQLTSTETGSGTSVSVADPGTGSQESALAAMGFEGAVTGSNALTGGIDLSSAFPTIDATHNSFKVELNSSSGTATAGQTATVTLSTSDTKDTVVSDIQSQLDNTFGKGVVSVGINSNNQLTLSSDSANSIAVAAGTNDISSTLFGTTTGGTGTAEASNKNSSVAGTDTVEGVAKGTVISQGANDQFNISVDGGSAQTITLSAKTYATSQDLVNEINNQIGSNSSLVGKVQASVDNTGKIVFTSASTGSSSDVKLSDPTNKAESALGALGYEGNAGAIQGSTPVDISKGVVLSGTTDKFSVTLGNQTKTIDLSQNSQISSDITAGVKSSRDTIVEAFQQQLDSAFGAGAVTVSTTSSGSTEHLVFTPNAQASAFTIANPTGQTGVAALIGTGTSVSGTVGSNPTDVTTSGTDGHANALANSTLLSGLTDSNGNNLGLTTGNVINISGTQNGQGFSTSLTLNSGSTVGDLLSQLRGLSAFQGATVSLDTNSGDIAVQGADGATHDISNLKFQAQASSTDTTAVANFDKVFGSFNVTQQAQDASQNNSLTFQIGANQGQTMSVGIGNMNTDALRLSSVDVSTQQGAETAISVINNALNTVSQQRANLGAYQNRLEHTINNLSTSSQNLTTAQSGITDTDMAATMANFTKDNVLQQAAVSMLAQANQQPQMVLKLLG